MRVTMRVTEVRLDPATQSSVAVLEDHDRSHAIPVPVGLSEARTIAGQLGQVEFTQPFTHELITRILLDVGARLVGIEMHGLLDTKRGATLHVQHGDRPIVLTCRVSDALALSVHSSAPLWVSQQEWDRAVIESERGTTFAAMDAAIDVDLLSAVGAACDEAPPA